MLAGGLAPVYDDMLPLLAELGLANDLHRVGALWVYDTEAGFERDAASQICAVNMALRSKQSASPKPAGWNQR